MANPLIKLIKNKPLTKQDAKDINQYPDFLNWIEGDSKTPAPKLRNTDKPKHG